MNREEMIIYWRDAAEKAEAKVIEQREKLSELQQALSDQGARLRELRENQHKNNLEICRLRSELEKRGSK